MGVGCVPRGLADPVTPPGPPSGVVVRSPNRAGSTERCTFADAELVALADVRYTLEEDMRILEEENCALAAENCRLRTALAHSAAKLKPKTEGEASERPSRGVLTQGADGAWVAISRVGRKAPSNRKSERSAPTVPPTQPKAPLEPRAAHIETLRAVSRRGAR